MRESTGGEYLPKNAAGGPTHREWSRVEEGRRTGRGRRIKRKGKRKEGIGKEANRVMQYFIQMVIE